MSPPLKRLLFPLVALALVVVLLEAALTGLSAVSHDVERLLAPPWKNWERMEDPVLGFRPDPRWRDHDELGFRNPRVPERAEVVVFGDSQSYGAQVAMEEAWPRRLEQLTGLPIYNMAYNEYGPAHALILLDEALRFRPRFVIDAFYSGNDLYDSFTLVHDLGQLPHLATTDEAKLDAIERAEEIEKLADEARRVFDMQPAPRDSTFHRLLVRPLASLKLAVSSHSKVYGLGRAALRVFEREDPRIGGEVTWERMVAFAEGKREFVQLLDAEGMRTVLTGRYRTIALDLDDPRIEEGLSISLGALEEMHAKAAEAGAELIVLFVPTKETVFASIAPPELLRERTYARLLELEARMWERAEARFDAAGIRTLDLTPVLRGELERGVQPYRLDWDGHPTPTGHAAIAAAVAELLGDLQIEKSDDVDPVRAE